MAALRGCSYKAYEIAQVMTHMLSLSGLSGRFPSSVRDMEKVIIQLLPHTEPLCEDSSACRMRVTELVAESSTPPSRINSARLESKSLAALLTHAFLAVASTSDKQDQTSEDISWVELRGTKGYLDLSTILLWLIPDGIALSLQHSTQHPCHRTYSNGDQARPLILQLCTEENQETGSGSGWSRIPWSSMKSTFAGALDWVGVARPLFLRGTAGLFGGVALTAANKYLK